MIAAYVLVQYATSGTVLNNHFDDSYITYRYAANLARGDGLVFNVGERTDAASSFSFTILLAGAYLVGLRDLETVSTAIGVASAALSAATVFYAGAAYTQRWLTPAAMALASACHGFIAGWASSGMETTFFALLVTVFVARFFVLQVQDRWTTALVCLLVLTRVEGILLVGAWFATLLLQASSRALRRRLVVHGAACAAVVLALYGFKWIYYGSMLPHSYHFKEVAFWYIPKPNEIIDVWKQRALFVLMLGLGGIAVLKRRSYQAGLFLFFALSVLSILRGPWAWEARYSTHLLPPLALLGALALDQLIRRVWPLALAFTFLIYRDVDASYDHMRSLQQWYSGHQICRRKVGEWVARNVPANSVVLSSDIGSIAYRSLDVRYVDMCGLTSADVLEQYMRHENADAILLSRRAQWVADSLKDGYQAVRFMNGGVTSYPLPASALSGRVKPGEPRFSCQSPDGLTFAASQIIFE